MQGGMSVVSQGGLGGSGADSSLQDTDWIPAVVGVPMEAITIGEVFVAANSLQPIQS